MTAKYPASIATTADLGQPNASDMLDSPDHASLHRQITDEIIAIETALGVGLANAGGVTGFANLAAFPATGVVNKVYLALDTGKMYRWDTGTTAYVAIGGGGTVAGALHYDGAKDVTAALGTYVPTQGATITASAAGAVNASWPGAAGQTVSIGDVLMFDGTNWHVQAGIADVDLMVRKTDVLAGAGLHDLTAALAGFTPAANMVVKASKAGTPHASWVGITGTVKAGAVYQYNGTAWVVVDQTKVPTAGASNLMYVNVAGDTMYGPLVIDVDLPVGPSAPYAAKIASIEIRGSDARRIIGIGKGALENGTTASGSVAVGYNALRSVTTGFNNVAIGLGAMEVSVNSGKNIAIGYNAAHAATYLLGCVALGYDAMGGASGGVGNIAIGESALTKNASGNFNVAICEKALGSNTTGTSNISIGSTSMEANTSGARNSAYGQKALFRNISGNDNVAFGSMASSSCETESASVAIGGISLCGATGSKNVSIGYASGINTSGLADLFPAGTFVYSGPFDTNAIYYLGGSGNAAVTGIPGITQWNSGAALHIKSAAGITITGSATLKLYKLTKKANITNSISIGYMAMAAFDNSTAIGTNSLTDKANQVVLGDNTVTEVKTHGLYVGTIGGVSQRMIGLQELKTIVAAAADFNALKAAIAALT